MNWERGDELRADPGDALADGRIVRRKRRPVWSFLAVVLVATAFFGVIYYAYRENGDFGHSGPPPLIKAEAGPTKIRPAQPGGQEIPFQNSTVYDRLSQGGQKPQVEKLLPPPEVPVERPAAVAAPPAPEVALAPPPAAPAPAAPTAAPPVAAVPAAPPASAPVPAPSVLPPAPGVAPPPRISSDQFSALQKEAASDKAKPPEKPTSSPTALAPSGAVENKAPPKAPPSAPPAVVASAAAPLVAAPAKPAPAIPAAATAKAPEAKPGNGVYRIQIGSVRSESEVAAEWGRLRERFPQTLSTLKVSSQKVDLAGGPFYRIQAGPLDAVKAKAACDRLQAQGAGCIVLKP